MLRSLSKLLKFPVYGVQFTNQAMKCDSIKSLAGFYWNKLQPYVQNRKVHLCGLGFGGLVAVEMAMMNQAKCASLTILDCGQQSDKFLGSFNRIETDALLTFARKYLPEASHEEKYELVNKLVRLNSLQRRVEFLVDELMKKSRFQLDGNDLREAAYAFVRKSQMVEEYSPDLKNKLAVKCEIVKATGERSDMEEMLKGCCRSVDRFVVGCDQRSMLEGDKCLEIGQFMNGKFIEFLCH